LAYDATSLPGIPTPLGDNVFFHLGDGMGWDGMGVGRVGKTALYYHTW